MDEIKEYRYDINISPCHGGLPQGCYDKTGENDTRKNGASPSDKYTKYPAFKDVLHGRKKY